MNLKSSPSEAVSLVGLLRQDPTNGGLLEACVQAAMSAGDADTAREALSISQQAGERTLLHAYLDATILMHERRWSEAVDVLSQVSQASAALEPSQRSSVWFSWGYALYRAERLVDGAQVLRRCIEQGSPAPGVLACLERILHRLEGPAAAVQAWDSATDWRDDEAAGVASLACFDASDVARARDLARQCLERRQDCREAVVTLASVALLDGQVDRAAAMLEDAVVRSPEDGRTWSTLAAARAARRDLPGALAAYREAVKTIPGHIGTWIGQAWIHITLRQLDEAKSCLDSALAIDDRFSETHGGLAVWYALTGDAGRARRHLDIARRLDPASMSWRYADALLHGEAETPEAVERLARTLLSERGIALRGFAGNPKVSTQTRRR